APGVGRGSDVRDRVPLDAAALLGARSDDPRALRERAHPDAARRARRARDRTPDRVVHGRPGRGDDRTGRLRDLRARVRRRGAPSRGRVRLGRVPALARHDESARGGALPLFAPLPRAALRRDGARRGRMTDPLIEGRPPDMMYPAVEPDEALARKNALWATALVVLFLVL